MTTAAMGQLQWVTVFGHEIRVSVRAGTGAGPPLVLCNGIGASLELLNPFVDHMDPRITVISFDIPGVGSSPVARFPYTFGTMAAIVCRLLTQLDHGRFDVLGISWGGGLAQQIAFQYPRRCRRVVLVSTATGALMIPARPSVLAKMLTPRRYRDRDYAKRIAAELYGGTLRKQPELVGQLMHEHSRIGTRRGYVMQLLAGAFWTSLPALPMIRQPVLLLAGTDDPIIPLANARMMARLLPDARLHVFDDGHLGLVTAAETLAPIVSSFLTEQDR